jgi:hypothetical protein
MKIVKKISGCQGLGEGKKSKNEQVEHRRFLKL